MGSETTTYTDIQIQRLMSKPEEAYKQYMLEAFKQIRYGMRHVNAHYQTGIIDTRSLYNDGFLKNLGYDPAEKIKYTLLDPALTLSWMRSNISPSVENISAQWRAPTLAELAIEIGFDGIGRYYDQDFVHCDVRDDAQSPNAYTWTDHD